ncbi:21439_t:CDS:1, partial [Racocetra persica]
KSFFKKSFFKIAIMNQPVNQVIGQPLMPQTANILVNSSFDNLTAEQKYEILTEGTDPFTAQETGNQAALQFPAFIFLGSHFG